MIRFREVSFPEQEVAFAYVLYGMSYTGTSMPFGAMASVVSDDPIQRSKLSRARIIGGTIVGIVGLSIVPDVCFDKQSNILPERFTFRMSALTSRAIFFRNVLH